MSRVFEEMSAIAKMQARVEGRAVLISDVLRVDPDPDAFVLAPIKMAGEGRLWAVAYGRRGDAPAFSFTPDPRNRDDEASSVINPLAVTLEEYFQECRAIKRAPQVWVSSGSAVRLLSALSERRGSRHDANVAKLGLRLHFLSDRHDYAGQQVLHSASQVLSAHFATGQSPLEDQHLGAFLAWFAPGEEDAAEAARVAEDSPAGVNTDVDFDLDAADLLQEFSGPTRGRSARRKAIAHELDGMLRSVAVHIYELIEQSIQVLESQNLPKVPQIQKLRNKDFDAFDFFMEREFVPLRASADEAGRQLAAREAAIDSAANVFLGSDSIERSLGIQSGDVIEGTISDLTYGSRSGSVHEITFETGQSISTLRVGDTVRIDSTKKIELQLVRQGPLDHVGERTLSFRVEIGKTFVEQYFGEEVTLLPTGGSFFDRSKRPVDPPWIIDRKAALPTSAGRRPPSDPVQALEGLR